MTQENRPQAPLKCAALVGKHHESTGGAGDATRQASCAALLDVHAFLRELGLHVLVEAECAQALGLAAAGCAVADMAELGRRADVGVAVGGDGTMLGMARQMAPFGTPLIGINQGRLGFITDIALEHYRHVLPPMLLQGRFESDTRALLHGRVMRESEGQFSSVFEALAMNDVVVRHGAAASMIELEAHADGRFIARFRADGLIVATPTGSTAYSLAVGGPILHPQLPGWVLAPIAPQALSNRPIVLADPAEIVIRIVGGPQASASFDTQSVTTLRHGDCIVVRRSPHRAHFLHPEGWSYFDTLRHKLHWNQGAV